MKRYHIYLLAAAALTIAALSCTKQTLIQEGQDAQVIYNEDPAAMRFSARTDVNVADETKTAMGETAENLTAVNWTAGDGISVFDANGDNVQFTTASDAVTSAVFAEVGTGTFVEKTGDAPVYYAVYPYSESNSVSVAGDDAALTVVIPDVQNVVNGSFAEEANVAVAKSDAEGVLNFSNVCGYLRFYISKGDRITSVKISGNNGESLAGTVKVKWEDGVPVISEVVDGKTSITFKKADGSTFTSNEAYFIPLIPQEYSKGIKIEMTTVENDLTIGETVVPLTQNPVKTSSSSMKVERNTVLRLPYWDRLEWRSAKFMDMEDIDENTVADDTFGTANYIYKGAAGSEKELYSVVANTWNTGINKSSKILKFDGTAVKPTDYSSAASDNTKIRNGRILLYLSTNFYSRDIQRCFNAVRMKVYIPEDYPEKHTPRLQWGYNKWGNNIETGKGTVRNRPIFTPTYVNGVKLGDKYIHFGSSSNNSETIGNLKGDKNAITDAWLTSYSNAVRKGDWNDFIFLIGDVENANNKFLVGYTSGNNYLRIHPFFPSDPDNATAYHPTTYGVMYIDDIEIIDF